MTELSRLSREVEAASFAEMRLFMAGQPLAYDAALQRLDDAKARMDAHVRAMPRVGRA